MLSFFSSFFRFQSCCRLSLFAASFLNRLLLAQMLLCFSLRLLEVQLTMRETFFQHSTPPRPNPTLWLCDILRLAWLIKMSNAVHILNAVAHRRSKKK